MNWKTKGVTYGSLMVAIGLAFTYNIPPWNKPAALIMHDHAQRYVTENRKMILVGRDEMHETRKLMSNEFSLYIIQSMRLKVLESDRLTEQQKTAELQRLQDKIDRLDKKLDKSLDNLEYIDSMWSNYGVANNSYYSRQDDAR